MPATALCKPSAVCECANVGPELRRTLPFSRLRSLHHTYEQHSPLSTQKIIWRESWLLFKRARAVLLPCCPEQWVCPWSAGLRAAERYRCGDMCRTHMQKHCSGTGRGSSNRRGRNTQSVSCWRIPPKATAGRSLPLAPNSQRRADHSVCCNRCTLSFTLLLSTSASQTHLPHALPA